MSNKYRGIFTIVTTNGIINKQFSGYNYSAALKQCMSWIDANETTEIDMFLKSVGTLSNNTVEIARLTAQNNKWESEQAAAL